MVLRRKGLVPDITISWTNGRHEGNFAEQRYIFSPRTSSAVTGSGILISELTLPYILHTILWSRGLNKPQAI